MPRTNSFNFALVCTSGALAAAVGYKLFHQCKIWRLQWKLFKLPGPAGSPLLGNLKALTSIPIHQQLRKWSQEIGIVYRFRVLHRMVVVISDPDTSKYLKHGPTYMPKAQRAYQGFKQFTGSTVESILTSPENEYWKAVRKALAPAFSVNSLKQVFPEAVALSISAAEWVQGTGGRAIDVDNLAQRITVDVIGKMVFGVAFNACKFEAYNEPLDVVSNLLKSMHGLGLNPLYKYFPFLERPRKFRQWCKRYGELAGRVVRNAQASPPPPNSIMAALLSMRDPRTGKPLTLEQLKSEVALLLVAGFETTAHSIAWTLMCLSTHPAAMERVEEELATLGLLATKDRPMPRALEWGDMGRLKQLDAAINESMRLFPATSTGSAREPTQDINVGGVIVPKGAVVMLHTYSIHRSQVWGEDADEYKPERWIGADGEGFGGARREGYQPFSLGPRDCVGQNLAMLELRCVCATLLGRFRLQLSDEMGGYRSVEQAARQFITLKPMVPSPPGHPPRSGLLMHCIPRSL